jgi:hypothetical protein
MRFDCGIVCVVLVAVSNKFPCFLKSVMTNILKFSWTVQRIWLLFWKFYGGEKQICINAAICNPFFFLLHNNALQTDRDVCPHV